MSSIEIICPKCRVDLNQHNELECTLKTEKTEKHFRYDYNSLLLKRYKNKYLLNQILNNNAKMVYDKYPEGNLAIGGQNTATSAYIKERLLQKETQVGRFSLIDIGCGPQDVPDYLNGLVDNITIYGLDILPNSNFKGFRIIGCSEFLPFSSNSFDYVIFSGSLDQVTDVKDSISESIRILKKGGHILVRLSGDPKLLDYLNIRVRRIIKSIYFGINHNRFTIYKNDLILYRPLFAIDPYHKKLVTKENVIHFMKKKGFCILTDSKNTGDRIIEFKKLDETI